jgi:integral membrane protein
MLGRGDMDSRKLALNAYRVMAYVTGTGLVILLCIAVPIQLLDGNDIPAAIVGTAHGFLYMGYVGCALVLAERCRWRPVFALLIVLAGTVPFASFYAERKVTKLVRQMPPPKPRRRKPAGSRSPEASQ